MTDDNQALVAEWTRRLTTGLGIDPAVVDANAVLALAGQAAHSVVRPAAPVTTYIVGFAAGLLAADGIDADEAYESVRRATAVLIDDFAAERSEE
ncbi:MULTISPECIES: DUF6457 domain-containing protein [unclassified Microbacterium]|uniref:DUF6457 domain-containing protein n=1 Tax=unclassified Microbacterium TaxID=2609290 RepID=UPI0037454328